MNINKYFVRDLGTIMGLMLLALSNPLHAITIAGTSDGTFENPVGPATMVTTGVGTSTFTWGVGYGSDPSSMTFTGSSFSTTSDAVFSIGTLDYFNGTIYADTGADSVDLLVGMNFTDPTGITSDFSYMLNLINTPNVYDPYTSADYVTVANAIPDSYFSVGGVNYTLEILGFGNIIGSGFETIDGFHVLEGQSATADILGRVTVAQVPEPSALLLLMAGLVGFGLRKQRVG